MICDELWKHRIRGLAISVRNLAKKNNNEKALQYKKNTNTNNLFYYTDAIQCYRDLRNNKDNTAQTVQVFLAFKDTSVPPVLERISVLF
jgi:hypothetical protein